MNQPYANKKIVLYGEGCRHEIPGITCVNDGQRRGRVARLNDGLRFLKTDYVSFLGVDDYFLPHVLGRIAGIIEESGKREWYYGGHLRESDNVRIPVHSNPFDPVRLRKENYIAGGAVFLRRDIALQHGGFMGFGKSGYGDDWVKWRRVGEKYTPVIMDLHIYVERIGTSTIRGDKGFIARQKYKMKRRTMMFYYNTFVHRWTKLPNTGKVV